MRLVISDDNSGQREVTPAALNGINWRRCDVHSLREVASHLPKSAQGLVLAALRNVSQQTTPKHAREAMTLAIELLEHQHPNVARIVRDAEDDVLAYFAPPEADRRQVRSTNPLARLKKDLRARTRVIRVSPTDASALRLVGVLLLEQHEERAADDRRDFSAESMKLIATPTIPFDGGPPRRLSPTGDALAARVPGLYSGLSKTIALGGADRQDFGHRDMPGRRELRSTPLDGTLIQTALRLAAEIGRSQPGPAASGAHLTRRSGCVPAEIDPPIRSVGPGPGVRPGWSPDRGARGP